MVSAWKDELIQLARQINHWTMAANRLEDLGMLASPKAWEGLENYLNTTLRTSLGKSLQALKMEGEAIKNQLLQIKGVEQIKLLQNRLNAFQNKYLKTETTLDFYADAINTRTNPQIIALLRACDFMAIKSMQMILEPNGKPTPPVLTYIDKGLGASILKAGLRLWDGNTQSPVAAIKIVRHNLFRPTALVHEAGHQVAHILNWNDELAAVLHHFLKKQSKELAEVWSSWSSEIAADTFGFVHTGYASVAGLHDVVSGSNRKVFRFIPLDPHPVGYLRVLLGIAFCRRSFKKGAWDSMEKAWKEKYKLRYANKEVRQLAKYSLPLLPGIARLCLEFPMKAFSNKSLVSWLPVERIHPNALLLLEKKVGPSLYQSPYWLSKEALRLLGWNGYQVATQPIDAELLLRKQRNWMLKLGGKFPVANQERRPKMAMN